MKLADIVSRVVIDPRKLADYALDPDAPWGRHKATIFKESLGFIRENYADLWVQIEDKAMEGEAAFHSEDQFGRRYTVDLLIRGTEGRQTMVRTGWLVRPGADEARMVTLYVKKAAGEIEQEGEV